MAEDIKKLEVLTETGVATFVAGYTNDPINPPTDREECDSTRVRAGLDARGTLYSCIQEIRSPFHTTRLSPIGASDR